MEFMAISGLLGVSLASNFVLLVLLRRKKRAKTRNYDITAADLLHDLTRGPAVVRIEVIDAKNLFLRSPRS